MCFLPCAFVFLYSGGELSIGYAELVAAAELNKMCQEEGHQGDAYAAPQVHSLQTYRQKGHLVAWLAEMQGTGCTLDAALCRAHPYCAVLCSASFVHMSHAAGMVNTALSSGPLPKRLMQVSC